MKNVIKQMLVTGFCIVVLCLGAYAQSKSAMSQAKPTTSTSDSFLSGAGKVSIVVVGSAAKIAWRTTKFVARDVAVPVVGGVLKPMALKMAPSITKFTLKNSAKFLLPLAVKLSIL